MPKICLMCGKSFPDATTFCPTDGSALRASVQGDDLIGELVAERYLITDMISQGGMGAVYVASDVRLPQQFAIKVLKQQNTTDQSLIARFRQEAEAVCRINHDRVARVFDFGFLPDDRAYIVMEYVAGKTLRKLSEERGPLPPADVARIIVMAAEGIDAAHRLGIVHRDLKPENVMLLDDPGGGMRVKVLDFGIAKLESAEADQGYTKPGFVIGTPAWMSPEQLLGETLDARSDVYALGLVAFALLTGEHAFTGTSEQAEMMARISVPPRTLTEVMPSVAWPPELLKVFERTLSKSPANRPATTGQFAAALLAAVSGGRGAASSASPRSSRESTTTPIVVSPLAAASASALPPAASALGSSSLEATPAASTTARKSPILMGLGAVAVLVVAGVLWQQQQSSVGDDIGNDSLVPGPTIVQQPVADPPAPDTATTTLGADSANSVADGSTGRAPTATDGGSTRPVSSPVSSPVTPPVTPPVAGSTGGAGAGVTPPTRGTTTPNTESRNAELQRVMDEFDHDDSEREARETIIEINVLYGRLKSVSDRAYAQNYLGKAYLTVGDKTKACAAFASSAKIGASIESLRKDSEEFMMFAGCAP